MEGLPSFSDKEFWDDALEYYIENNALSAGDNGYVWDYFKYCLQTQNRFFFENPLVPVILERYNCNVFELSTDTKIYRARIDEERKYEHQCFLACEIKCIQERLKQEEDSFSDKVLLDFDKRRIRTIMKDSEYQEFVERKKYGFEGFDAKGSGAPPYYNVKTGGRCNPEYVSFLYAANDIHTAVAEVRPYFRDSVSIATLRTKKTLRLVDFYYELKKRGPVIIKGPDPFMNKIRSEFSILNKGNEHNYLITQYLTLLAQSAGFDGIRFRSSLVRQGTNYVIFNNSNCIAIESKMYTIQEVKYSIIPLFDT